MKASIILAHPDEKSFNHAIVRTAAARARANGHEVSLHDLYAERFDPVLPAREIPDHARLPQAIATHCRQIGAADGIIIVHPNWWGQPPAILKGWIDRVIRPRVAYRFLDGDSGEGVPLGLLKARAALVFNTSNTPPGREEKVFGDPLQLLWKNCIFDLCGVPLFYRRMFTVVVTSTPGERRGWLEEVTNAVNRYFPPDELDQTPPV
ncbi:MAG: NAD(P)H-dependent oxidoreductase [PVC group bacterium]